MFNLNPWITGLIIIIIIIFLYFVVIWTIRTYKQHIYAGKEGLEGKTAVVETALAPKGFVLVEGEHWAAVIDKGRAEPQEEVIVTKVEGLKLRVTRKV